MLNVNIFGGLRVIVDGAEVGVRGAPRRRILSLLSANSPDAVTSSRLVECLDHPDTAADPGNAVQAHIRRIRQVLEPGISGTRSTRLPALADGYALRPDDMDLWQARRLATDADTIHDTDPETAVQLLGRALDLWDTPWGELSGDPQIEPYYWALEQERLVVEDQWTAALVNSSATGVDCDRVIALAKAEPTREHRSVFAMQALFGAGRQVDALRLYDTVRRFLRDELGLTPGPQLTLMYQRVLSHDVELRNDRFPILGRTPQVPNDPLVGRERQLLELGELHRRHPLLTVSGPAGVGKSRVVHHWLRSSDPGRTTVWLNVDQYSARTIVHELGDALGVGNSLEVAGRMESIGFSIPRQGLLIVIDGADENRPAVIDLVTSFDQGGPPVRFIVTAQTPLGVPGEQVLRIEPLSIPDPGEPIDGTALQLARDRLGPRTDDATIRRSAVAADGLPYAIELITAAMSQDQEGVATEALATNAEELGLSLMDQVLDESILFLSPSARHVLDLLAVLPDGLDADAVAWHCSRRRPLGIVDPHEHVRVLGELTRAQFCDITRSDRGVRYVARQQAARALRHRMSVEQHRALMADNAEHLTDMVLADDRCDPLVPDTTIRAAVVGEPTNTILALSYLLDDPDVRPALIETLVALTPVVARLSHRRKFKAMLRRVLEDDLETIDRVRLVTCDVILEPDMSAITVRVGDLAEVTPTIDSLDLHPHWSMGAHVLSAIALGWVGALDEASAHLDIGVRAASSSPWAAATVDRYRSALLYATGHPREALELAIDSSQRLVDVGDDVEALGAMHFAVVVSNELPDVDTSELLARAEEINGKGGSVFEPLLHAELARYAATVGARDRIERYETATASLDAAGLLRTAAAARARLGLLLLDDGERERALDELLLSSAALLRLDPVHASLTLIGLSGIAHDQVEAGESPIHDPEELARLALHLIDVGGVRLLHDDVLDVKRRALLIVDDADIGPEGIELDADVLAAATAAIDRIRMTR